MSPKASIYIAAKYARRFDLRPLAEQLQALGYRVTSRWLWGGEDGKTLQQKAEMDMEDVRSADVLVFIGEPKASMNVGGGRWFEFGAAWALGKRCVAVLDMDGRAGGHDHIDVGHETVFTGLPDIRLVASQAELLLLASEEGL